MIASLTEARKRRETLVRTGPKEQLAHVEKKLSNLHRRICSLQAEVNATLRERARLREIVRRG